MGAAMETATVSGILLATTDEIEGRPVLEYFGIVTGEATMKATLTPAQVAGATRHGRLRSPKFEQQVRETRDLAVAAMAAHAIGLGATAVIAIAIGYTSVTTSTGGDILVVAASGTAVLL
jgi:uncharacterized protein YbjQ (UPF0145 family)